MSSVPRLTLLVQLPVPAEAEIPQDVLRQIQEATTRFGAKLVELAGALLEGPHELLSWEQELHTTIPRECIDPVTGAMIRAALEDPVVQMKGSSIVDSIPDARLQCSNQRVTIDLLGGGRVTVRTSYFLRRPPGRKRKGRGKSGNGFYPLLCVLGIRERLSPALASEMAREVVLGSLDEAQRALARRGVHRGRKVIRRVVKYVSRRALAYQKWLQESPRERPEMWNLAGKRIGIGLDGGRLRTRVQKKGRRRKSGRRGFWADWREPRVIVVYELDEKGRKRRRGYVRYDATIADADETFLRLASLLRQLGAEKAEHWVVLGDGAEWIWNRVEWLVTQLEYDLTKVTQVVDFWHAVEYLSEFTSNRPGWSKKYCESWIRRMKKLLRKGRIEELIEEMLPSCKGRRAQKLRNVVDRFERNKERMRYHSFKKSCLPIGSGVVESAVRRIINLRLKGAGIFWAEETAEGLLHLRAQYLSGDWDDHVSTILTPKPFWGEDPALEMQSQAA